MSGRPGRTPATRFFGGLMMAAGGVIAVTSGLCAVVVSVMGLADAIRHSSGSIGELITLGLPLVLLFGGVPFAVGLALFFVGRRLFREQSGGPSTGVTGDGAGPRDG